MIDRGIDKKILKKEERKNEKERHIIKTLKTPLSAYTIVRIYNSGMK